MNFKRIQWIFLVAFILFDIIVGCQLLFQNRFTITNNTQSRQSTVLKEMRADSISYQGLSKHQPNAFYISGSRSGDGGTLEQEMAKLHNQTSRFADSQLVSEFDSPIKVNAERPQLRLDQVVRRSRNVPLGDHYQYNAQLSSRREAVYTQMVKNQPVLSSDGQLRFRINRNAQVTGYTQTYLENPTTLQQRHNQIPNNSQIRWAILGYTKLLTTNNHNQAVYVPTWAVEIKTKTADTVQRLNVNAFNSTIMKSSPDTVNMDSINK